MVRSAPLGRLLLSIGVLTQAQLDATLVRQRTDKRRLGELLIEAGLIHPQQLAQVLSHQLSCSWISLAHAELSPEVLALIPSAVAIEHGVVPVHLRAAKGQTILYLAMDDPTDDFALSECAAVAQMQVRPMVAMFGEVKDALAAHYGGEPTPVPPQVTEASPPKPRDPTTAPPPPPAPLPAPPPLPKRPPPKKAVSAPPVDIDDVIEIIEVEPREKRAPTVLALNAPDNFLAQCKTAVASLGATLVDGSIVRAGDLVAEHRPCAIVVTDDVYAFDRSGLNRLALDNDAHLVVWSEEADGHQLQPLLEGAIDRWGRSSYEKGAIVDGRYELLRDLVDDDSAPRGLSRWQVRNVRTARRSVLALAIRSDGGPETGAAIRRQQKALARVTHPGAVELRDAGTTELGDPYVVLEPLEGRTLDGLVAARTKLVANDACAVIAQVADVLAAAHAAGVVHHRVRPENILITRDGYGFERVKLTDWGHATVHKAGIVDPSSREDVVSLGQCAFEALTGRRPEPDETLGDAALPEAIAAFVREALRANAPDAPAIRSARDVADAISTSMPSARERTQLLEASPAARAQPRHTAPPPPAAATPATIDAVASTPEATGAQSAASGEAAATAADAQRRFTRAAYRTPVHIEVSGIGSLDGRSEDISLGGLLVVSRGSLKGGTEVTLRYALPLDGRIVSEPAIVKWSRPARSDELCALGVEMLSPSAETTRQIDRYVALMGSEPGQ